MDLLFVFICMVFGHIIGDYPLQGILASMKQKQWWEKQIGYSKKYENDWIPSLLAHCICWTFLVMLPIAFYYSFNLRWLFYVMFVWNIAVHFIVDNAKANKKVINLVTDQFIHLAQIIMTFAGIGLM